MNNESINQLLRRTRRKLFFARWLTASTTFYFYAFFVGTALILTDRIGGELDLWNPFTLEWVILSTIAITLVAGGLYGAVHAWRNRCSKREIAWMIDRRCDADALLVTALDADTISVDSSWASLIREQANELTNTYLRKNLFRLPGQGIRWMFLVALLLDLGLVLFLTPTYEIKRKTPSGNQVKKQTDSSTGSGSGPAGEKKNEKEASGNAQKQKNGSEQNKNQKNQKKNKQNKQNQNKSSQEDDPSLFGKQERHEHEREQKVLEEEAGDGPTREGLVRMFESGDAKNEDGGSTDDDKKEDKSEPDPSRAEALHRQYQRQAERMIWRRSLSREERELVRRYYEEIRPTSDGPEQANEPTEQP